MPNSNAKKIGDMGVKDLLQILESRDIRTKLDESWKKSSSTGREYGFAVFDGDEVASTGIIEGTDSNLPMNTGELILQGIENNGLFYSFLHTHPSNGCLLPTPADLDALSYVRAVYKSLFGIDFRPVHGVVKHEEYGDQKTLKLLLYQEKTKGPVWESDKRAEKVSGLVTALYEMAMGRVPDCRSLSDSEAAIIFGGLNHYNAALITYHKDERVSDLPYMVVDRNNLRRFNQTILYDGSGSMCPPQDAASNA